MLLVFVSVSVTVFICSYMLLVEFHPSSQEAMEEVTLQNWLLTHSPRSKWYHFALEKTQDENELLKTEETVRPVNYRRKGLLIQKYVHLTLWVTFLKFQMSVDIRNSLHHWVLTGALILFARSKCAQSS